MLPIRIIYSDRGIIHHDSQLCASECGNTELTNHLFIKWDHFGSIWQLVRNWLHISSVNTVTVSDPFAQFSRSAGNSKIRRFVMHLIWFAYV